MGSKGILAFIRNFEILSPAGIELKTGQLVGHACCNFSENLSPELSLFAVGLCTAWLSSPDGSTPCF